ncbi:uncharacterized protein I303_108096 [Kwoniella dejecticola CBS 10117]|uniref:Zn(2)-C6 fungal-type domain-containing protein n=2 Tax=Kwoniella dejecticola CBS 10117 TaxID=1296121 RepID=A0AAJ8KXD6_9TREE
MSSFMKSSKTCDQCRVRKIKCVGSDREKSASCDGCDKLSVDCTYDYIRKKPGRKNSLGLNVKRRQSFEGHPLQNDHREHSGAQRHRTQPHLPISHTGSHLPRALLALDERFPTTSSDRPAESPARAHISPSNQQLVAASAESPYKSIIDPNKSWLDSLLDGTGFPPVTASTDLVLNYNENPAHNADVNMSFASDQAQLLSLESLVGMNAFSNSPGKVETMSNQGSRREPQVEDLTNWTNITHFIALFLKYLYPLLPLIHKPTFSEQLATRRDLIDTDFRALLLSIVAYVISQLPTSRLVNDQFDIEGLKRLQRRCHRTCKALQRTYYGPTNSTQISTIIFDTFYLLSIGLGHTAGARLGQAIQLAYSMGMHSDAKTEALGLDPIEVQLRRRVFWQLYAADKTRAISGLPMMINDFQGVCSLPEPVDDEFITSQGSFAQPLSRPSPIAGFVACSKLFRIMSECFFHHRCIMSNMRTVDTAWTVSVEDRLHQLLRDFLDTTQDHSVNGNDTIKHMLAVQRANILITAAICKFALSDLRIALQVDKDQMGKEREVIAREIHSSLMNIPVEDLASNGESVRSKIFHIVCALCDQNPASAVDQGLIWDWYNMFSAISFVQMPPPPPEAALDSRANSPPPAAMQQQQQSQYPLPGPPTGSSSGITMNPGSI